MRHSYNIYINVNDGANNQQGLYRVTNINEALIYLSLKPQLHLLNTWLLEVVELEDMVTLTEEAVVALEVT